MPEFKPPKFQPTSLGGPFGGISDVLNAAFASKARKKQQEAIDRANANAAEKIKQNPAGLHNLSEYESKDPIGSIERNVMYNRLRDANQATLTARVQKSYGKAQDLISSASSQEERASAFAEFDKEVVAQLDGADAESITSIQPLITRAQGQLSVLSEKTHREQVHRETSVTVIGNLTKDAEVGFGEDNPGALDRLAKAHKDKFITTGQLIAFQDKGIAATFSVDNVLPLFEANVKPEAVFNVNNPDGLFQTYDKQRKLLLKAGVDPGRIPDNLNEWISTAATQIGITSAEDHRDLIQGASTLDEALSIVYNDTEKMFQKLNSDVLKATKDPKIALAAESNARNSFRIKAEGILKKLAWEDKAAKAKVTSEAKIRMEEAVRIIDGSIIDIPVDKLETNLVSDDDIHLLISDGNESQRKKAIATAKVYEEIDGLGDFEDRESAVEHIASRVGNWLDWPENENATNENINEFIRTEFGFSAETAKKVGDSFTRLTQGSTQQLAAILQGETIPQISPSDITNTLATQLQGINTSDGNLQASVVSGLIPEFFQQVTGGNPNLKFNKQQSNAFLRSLGENASAATRMSVIRELAPITDGNSLLDTLSYLDVLGLVDPMTQQNLPNEDQIRRVRNKIPQHPVLVNIKGSQAYIAHVAFQFANDDTAVPESADKASSVVAIALNDVRESNVVQFSGGVSGWWDDFRDNNEVVGSPPIYVPDIEYKRDNNTRTIPNETAAILVMAADLKHNTSGFTTKSIVKMVEAGEDALLGGAFFELQPDGSFIVYNKTGGIPTTVTQEQVVELHDSLLDKRASEDLSGGVGGGGRKYGF